MRAGTVIGGYTLLEEFRVVGAGLSEWTFAVRDGREYFLKRFLSPTYPDDAAPGSPATKARKRARCAEFEAHHRGIQAALQPVTSYGGNLIATLDFFRDGAKYYKVTEKVDLAGLSADDVAGLAFPLRLVLLKTVAHSLKILHALHIVHSDLKPSNVLIKKTELGYPTKLIDFDSSYLVGTPPPAEEIVGTMNYYSPELVRYIQGADNGAELSTASDIFALGLVYAEYLTGSLPTFEGTHRSAAIAVMNGAVLHLRPGGLPPGLVDLVDRMLLAQPTDRPSVSQVHSALMALPVGTATAATKLRLPAPTGSGLSPTTALRGKGLRLAGSTVPATAGAAGPSPAVAAAGTAPAPTAAPGRGAAARADATIGRLVGRLLDKFEERRSR